MPEAFSDDEIKRLGQALASGGELTCPTCRVPLDRRAIPPRSDVSYVRDRLWLTCPECHRAVVLDRR
jgi:hypothetical protein